MFDCFFANYTKKDFFLMTEKKLMVLLGARGRLGRAFAEQCADTFEIIEVGSKPRAPQVGQQYSSSILELRSVLRNRNPELVINLAAAWGPKVTQKQIWQAGYEFPKGILELISNGSHPVKWIQFDSYYNLFFDLYGLDKDFYSQTKRKFFDFLQENPYGAQPVQVISPHLVGRSEPPQRFFRVVTDGIFRNKPYSIGSGEKYLPFLHFSDAANQLCYVSQSISLGSFGRINLRPAGQSQLRHITSQAHMQFGVPEGIVRFSPELETNREFYAPLSFENNDWLPEPVHRLKSILDEQWHERVREREITN
jgi:hypothetical protein